MKMICYDSIDSTMDEAKRLLHKDFEGNLESVILAKVQTGGRGRHGRIWVSRPGNLFMSYVASSVEPSLLSQFALLWGIVLQQVISQCTQSVVQCKWPNDVLVDGKKIAGVLVERYEGALIVGVGVNLEYYPEKVLFHATCLKEHVAELPTPVELAHIIADEYKASRILWEQNGFDQVRVKWLKNAWKLHEEINIRQEDRSVVGIFETIDAIGALILKSADGLEHKLYVGDLIEEVTDVTRN